MARLLRVARVVAIGCVAALALGYLSALVSERSAVEATRQAAQDSITQMYRIGGDKWGREHYGLKGKSLQDVRWLPATEIAPREHTPEMHALFLETPWYRRHPEYLPREPVAMPWAFVLPKSRKLPFLNVVYAGWAVGELAGEGDASIYVSLFGFTRLIHREPLWFF